LPFGVLFAMNVINSLLSVFSNPVLLFTTFLLAGVPIYIFASSKFLFSGIQKAKPCSSKLKEWIKVNAIVSILFAALMFLASLGAIIVIQNPALITQAIQQMNAQQKELVVEMTPHQMKQFLTIVVAMMLPFSIILVIHIILSFRLLKIYHYVFDKD
jgi:hypothetical protein